MRLGRCETTFPIPIGGIPHAKSLSNDPEPYQNMSLVAEAIALSSSGRGAGMELSDPNNRGRHVWARIRSSLCRRYRGLSLLPDSLGHYYQQRYRVGALRRTQTAVGRHG